MAACKATVRPLRRREYSAELGCRTSRVLGYGASCSCGWRGPFRKSRPDALSDASAHRRAGEDSPPL